MKILLFPDAHNTQNSNLSRYVGAGKVIEIERPDAIIIMGDWTAYNSISHWDMEKRLTMEGRRYASEIEVSNTALDLIEQPIYQLQQYQRDRKIRMYNPRKIFIEGNHEYWVQKYLEQNPSLEGQIGVAKDLHLEERGWEVVPYKDFIEIEEVLFTHVVINGAQQPISGSDICQVASRYVSKSTVFAHCHRFETKNYNRFGARNTIQILTCGCFFDPDGERDIIGTNSWGGLIMLDIYKPGRFEIKTYSLDRLIEGDI